MERCDGRSVKNDDSGTKVAKLQFKVNYLQFHPTLLVPFGTE